MPDVSLQGYDIIGDIHGCAPLLVQLLGKLGYQQQDGCYRHPERTAIFLGDLIDRGPAVLDTVTVVRTMVDQGAAKMVLGNHEYAAITYTTRAPASLGRPFLRQHTPRLKKMLAATLDEYHNRKKEWEALIEWLRTLPLYLEFDNFRVVHACWDEEKIRQLDALSADGSLADDTFLLNSVRPGSLENRIVERLLKGTDIALPEGVSIKSADGFTRDRFRTKFWKSEPKTYSDVVFQPDRIPGHLLKRPLSDTEKARLIHYDRSERPLFVGHYWRKGRPQLIRDNIACLDYGAVNRGKLVAYRIDTHDKKLSEERLIWVSA